MQKKTYLLLAVFLLALPATAQVLWSDDFNSHTIGNLSNDLTGATPGQGGWYVNSVKNAEVKIIAEPNKGNVLADGWTTNTSASAVLKQKGLEALWNNHTTGNNILKFEFEFYVGNNVSTNEDNTMIISLNSSKHEKAIIDIGFGKKYGPSWIDFVYSSYMYDDSKQIFLALGNGSRNSATIPLDTWIKAELFIDYNINYVFTYIPTLNIQAAAPFIHNRIPELVYISSGSPKNQPGATKKIDDFKITALKTRPAYLNVSNFISSKFNIYPNPATNVVNITNSENMSVNQVEIYDITGKLISIQNFNQQTELQLNIENLASGTYMLHLQTNEGIAVKKLVKK